MAVTTCPSDRVMILDDLCFEFPWIINLLYIQDLVLLFCVFTTLYPPSRDVCLVHSPGVLEVAKFRFSADNFEQYIPSLHLDASSSLQFRRGFLD